MANIFTKVYQAAEAGLDSYITKSRSNSVIPAEERQSLTELNFAENQQYGYVEKKGMVSPEVLKSMSRKDSIVIGILQTRSGQISDFTKPQKDRYTPGFTVEAERPADLDEEDKMLLADPNLDEEAYKQLSYELEQKKSKLQAKQKKDIQKIKDFVLHCGLDPQERDTTYKRMDFDKFCKLIVRDRLTYNYAAVELVPTKGEKDSKGNAQIHHFYPVAAGTIRYVSQKSSKDYKKLPDSILIGPNSDKKLDPEVEYRYVQLIRGRIVAAWPEELFVFEAANPTVDPEDNNYAPGELELLIQTVTSHLYAEAHNRNFFTQGIGTKGLLHIKGDNISRGQLEAFKRQWFNQLANSRNAFRPPIIGMADEVRWIPLAQTNREMEFEQWMHYLIRITCAIYQIDPSEINFDISKVNTSTLNESSNETRLKSSKDKGLKPLLGYIENIMNYHILPAWDEKLAKDYKFKFVGLDAESKQQEIDRLQKESQVWRTINEIRTYMGVGPIEHGDIILAAAYTQYLQQQAMAEQAQMQQDDMSMAPGNDPDEDLDGEGDIMNEIEGLADEVLGPDIKSDKMENPKDKEDDKKSDAKKSLVVEYHHFEEPKDDGE